MLGSYPLFTPDEGRYSEIAWEMVKSGDYITPRLNGIIFLDKPILYYWLQAFAISLFGAKEWALRLAPALVGVFGCLATYTCSRILFDRRTGSIAAFILATTPLYFGSAHYANMDLEVAVWISCSLLCFLTGMKVTGKSSFAFLMSAYIAAAFAFLTKGLIGIAFPALIIGGWILLTAQFNLLFRSHLIKGLCLAAIIIFPWYYLVQAANPEFLHYFFITQQVTRFVATNEFNNPTPAWFYLPIVLIGFFPWSCSIFQTFAYTIKNIWQNRKTQTIDIFLLIWIAVVFVFFSIPHSKTITYILPVFPPLSILTAKYLVVLWDHENTASIKRIILTFSLIVFVFALALNIIAKMQFMLFPAEFKPYFYYFATLLCLSAYLQHRIKSATAERWILLAGCTSVLFLLLLIYSAHQLNIKSVKPLALQLKSVLKPEDEVINYFKFYQDLPIYLNRHVVVTANWDASSILENDNWGRDLAVGRQFGRTDKTLINEKAFWQHWDSNKRVYVFLNDNYLDQFNLSGKKYYVIGKHRETLLFSNQPAIKL